MDPTPTAHRRETINIRLSAAALTLIETKAAALGRTRSDTVRLLLAFAIERMTDDYRPSKPTRTGDPA